MSHFSQKSVLDIYLSHNQSNNANLYLKMDLYDVACSAKVYDKYVYYSK